MKYLVVSRPVTNGGDHLIANKLIEVVRREKMNDEIIYKSGTGNFNVDFVNSFDGIIIGGEPLYENGLLNPEAFPLFELITKVDIPTTIIGAGWYGPNGLDEKVYSYKFSEFAIEVFNKIISTGGFLGCRDHITTRVLKNNGLTNILMTGCPVWYDFEQIDRVDINSNVNKNVFKIAISDPGVTKKPNEQEIKSVQAVNVIKKV